MKYSLFFLFLLLNISKVQGQLQDDFADGNFDSNPTWFGNSTKFEVSNEILQLMDGDAGSSNTTYLSVPALTSMEEETTWEFFFNLDFAPSTSNFARVYLNASNSDLSGELNGYFIKTGGISGSGDALELYRQDGSSTTLLISGTEGKLGTSPVSAFVRVVRTAAGEWSLFADYLGNLDPQLEGTATDNTYEMGAFFGFYCRYTSTRNEHFFFDDVFINPLFQDTEAPLLLDVTTESSTSILVDFSEEVEISTAENVANYSLNNGVGMPLSATIDNQDPSIVILELASALTNLTTYTLSINNIEDAVGNVSGAQSTDFTFYNIQAPLENDILITEIMADFNPPQALPEAEFIELYNNSDKVIQLEGLHFIAGTSNKALPEFLLLPGQYLILCDDEVLGEFQPFGETIILTTFPSLTNGGTSLVLEGENGNSIFEVFYTDDWYADDEKEDGGWSLEMINLDGNYDCGGNWRASENINGGTPGQVNSLFGANLETDGPLLLSAFAESEFEVLIRFDETLDAASVSVADFTISPNIGIDAVFVQTPDNKSVLLSTTSPLSESIIYTLSVQNGITDCLGNQVLDGTSTNFGLAQPIIPGDIIINEILFNPETGGKDFLELYNVSGKILNLNNLQISNTQKETGVTQTEIGFDYLLFPQDYVVITSDRENILAQYFVESPEKMIQNALPGFDNEEGNITLRYAFTVIDSFNYNEDMHFSLLEKVDGISLERLNPNAPSQSFGNWHSAAASVGYATPTTKNSQFIVEGETGVNILSIPEPRFSPDSDGFEDVLQINYSTDQNDYLINLAIYDATGRLITRLANNELLGSEGSFKWDGATNEGQKARMGIYVVWAEIFSSDGVIQEFKETCVLAGQLD